MQCIHEISLYMYLRCKIFDSFRSSCFKAQLMKYEWQNYTFMSTCAVQISIHVSHYWLFSSRKLSIKWHTSLLQVADWLFHKFRFVCHFINTIRSKCLFIEYIFYMYMYLTLGPQSYARFTPMILILL